jgi:hypothetical protein
MVIIIDPVLQLHSEAHEDGMTTEKRMSTQAATVKKIQIRI